MAMRMTLDGMIRALHVKAHELGDDPEAVRASAVQRNETALALLSEEARRYRLEAGDEFSH